MSPARRNIIRISFLCAVAAILPLALEIPAGSSPADLDPTFSGDGIVTTPIGPDSSYAYGMSLQADGRMVVVGTSAADTGYDFAAARYNVNGSPDSSFSSDGKLTTPIGAKDDYALDVAVQADGKIVVVGYELIGTDDADFALVRYNVDGSLDQGFSGDGKVTTAIGAGTSDDFAYAVAIQPDGKIIVAGTSDSDFALVRYNADGSLDPGFSDDGKVVTSFDTFEDLAAGVALQVDGKIVAVGLSRRSTDSKITFALARYNTDGTLDAGFSDDGKVTTPIGDHGVAAAVAMQSDGKIVAAGYTASTNDADFALARYLADGSLDPGFSGDGTLVTPIGTGLDYGLDLAIQPDGRIVAAGESRTGPTSTGFSLVRYMADGSLDPTFSSDGKTITVIGKFSGSSAIAIQANSKIVAAGFADTGTRTDFALARYVPVRHFDDVPANYWAFEDIETLAASSITGGCRTSPPLFCPTASVTRAQMAVFLVRAMGEEGNLPSYKGYFDDVPAGQWYTGYVERLYELGVTAGCGSGKYCPTSPVTRGQMAVFLLRGIGHAGHLPGYRGIFSDVPASNLYARFIEHLYDHGITSGCSTGPLRFCPGASATRAQMAVFLVKAFGL